MRSLLFYLFIVSIIACQGNSESADSDKDTTTSQSTDNVSATPQEQCYRKVLARDTFAISITETGEAISGTLLFDNYEKDSSRGSVKGSSSGDTLKLWYDFQSEGMNSVMEVYFKRVGDKLVRGVGTMDVKGDTSYFTNPSDIKFEEKESWDKVSCEALIK
jgi:hypothetical protein